MYRSDESLETITIFFVQIIENLYSRFEDYWYSSPKPEEIELNTLSIEK